jgi:hypothetical protein
MRNSLENAEEERWGPECACPPVEGMSMLGRPVNRKQNPSLHLIIQTNRGIIITSKRRRMKLYMKKDSIKTFRLKTKYARYPTLANSTPNELRLERTPSRTNSTPGELSLGRTQPRTNSASDEFSLGRTQLRTNPVLVVPP